MASVPRRSVRSNATQAVIGAAVGLVVGLGLLLARDLQVVESLELELVDLRTRYFTAQRGPDPRIVLVQIQDDDVAMVERQLSASWPWDLEYNAAIFRVLAAAGVRAVMVDVMHFDRGAGPDDVPGADALSGAERQRRVLEAGSAEAYRTALQAVPSAVAFELADQPQYEIAARVAAAATRLGEAHPPMAVAGIARSGANLPVRRVAEGATLLGFANVTLDPDGVVRRACVAGRWGDRPVLSLPLATASLVTGRPPRFGERVVSLEAEQRLASDGAFLVNFRGPAFATYPRVAPAKILEWADRMEEAGTVPPAATEALAGAIVVWAVNLAGLKDVVAAPTNGTLDGAELQATILDNLLHGDGRIRASQDENALLLSFLTVFVAAVVAATRGWLSHVVPVLAVLGVTAYAFVRFGRGTSIDIFTPLAGILLAWGATIAVRLVTEGRYNRWLEGTFGRYLAPSIIESLKRDPSLLELGGRRREITILFSDVVGFTSLCETLQPEQVVTLLNRHLTAHSAAVMAEGGVVDKFEGDAVMAFFGDPLPMEDHAVRACRAALAVMAELPRLRPVLASMGLDAFEVRIGLNSGPAIVGNMGSSQRFDYTCMGDAVNLASRLESANKAFGSTILIGPQTYAQAQHAIVAKPLADVIVVGREEAVPVYELLGLADGAPERLREHAEAFRKAHAAAKAGDLEGARAALDEADRARPEDGPVAWFRGVLARLEAGEEPSPWPGIVRLRDK